MDKEEATATAADWPIQNVGWTIQQLGDGHYEYFTQSAFALDLGPVPQGVTVDIKARRQINNPVIVGSGDPSSVVNIWRPEGSVRLDGQFGQVFIGQAPSTCQISCAVAPLALHLGPGTWDLVGPRDDNDRFTIVLAGPGRTTLIRGNPMSVTGGGDLRILDGFTSDRIDVTGEVHVSRPTVLGDLTCSDLKLAANLTANSINATGTGTAISGSHDLTVRSLSASGHVHVAHLEAESVKVAGGNLVVDAHNLDPDQLARACDVVTTEHLAIDPPSIGLAGQLSAREISVDEGGVIAGQINLNGAPSTLNTARLVYATTLSASEVAAIRVGGLLVTNLDIPFGAVAAGHLTIRAGGKGTAKSINADRAHIAGPLSATELAFDHAAIVQSVTSQEPVQVTERCDMYANGHMNAVALRGDATVTKDASIGAIHWEPTGQRRTLQIDGRVSSLTVHARDSIGELTGSSFVPQEQGLILSGSVTITPMLTATAGPGPTAFAIPIVHSRDESHITFNAEHNPIEVEELRPSAPVTIITTGGHRVAVMIHADATVDLACNTVSTLIVGRTPDDRTPTINLDVDGSRALLLSGEFESVHTARTVALQVPARTVIRELTGDAWLENPAGWVSATLVRPRIQHRLGRRAARLGACVARWARHPSESLESHEAVTSPGRLVTITGDGDRWCRPTARISGLDLTSLNHQEIDDIENAELVEPDPRAIRWHAVKAGREPGQIRADAQWALNLHQTLENKSTSGTIRSSIGWSAAHLQHRATRSTSKPEWLLRFVHRILGYGYKVWPPALTWVVASAAVTYFAAAPNVLRGNGRCGTWDWSNSRYCSGDLRELGAEYMHTLFFPFRLLRLSPDDSPWAYLPGWVQPIAGIAVGIPFVFTLLAIKRFFALSHDN